MRYEPNQTRAELVAQFRALADKVFAGGRYRSMMMSFAQYWNDQASDETHLDLQASTRDVPELAHECSWGSDQRPDDACSNCESALEGELSNVFGYGSYVDAMAPFCHEHGSQHHEHHEAYLPYAIARPGGAVEIVGRVRRPYGLVDGARDAGALWTDPRAHQLYREVCAHAGDDGPRQVLADYLLERGDPRGELLALALARALDPAASARREELFELQLRTWLGPLGAAIPIVGARFARGFLAQADVWAGDADAVARVRGAEAWGTVETLRYLPGSLDVLDPAMVALRDVGAVRRDGLRALAGSPPWAIEALHVVIDDEADLELLASIQTLPRLRRLTLSGAQWYRGVAPLASAPWWPQLEELALLAPPTLPQGWDRAEVAEAHAATAGAVITADAMLREVAVPRRVAALCSEFDEPAGWQLARTAEPGLEVTRAGWDGFGALDRLQALLHVHTHEPVRLVRSRYWDPNAADRAALGR